MAEKADKNLQESIARFSSGFSQNWLRYAALLVTGALTGLAGYTLTSNAFYTIALVSLAEGASLFWTARASDNGNKTQEFVSWLGSGIAWTAIIITDLASATILAKMANIEIFTAFRDVPAWAQNVVTYVLPVLAVTHGILGTIHHYFSEEAKLTRDVSSAKREAARQIAEASAQAEVNIAKAQAKRYKEMAESEADGIGYNRGEQQWNTVYNSDEREVGKPVPFWGNSNK